MLLIGVLVAILLGGAMAAPIFSGLSRTVEADWLGALESQPSTWASLVPELPSLFGAGLKRVCRYLFLQLPLAGLALIPVAGEVMIVGGEFLLTGMFLAATFLEAPFSRRDYTHKEKALCIRDNLPVVAGLGLGLEVMLLIPGMNLLILPVGVLAGTLVFVCLESLARVPRSGAEFTRNRAAVSGNEPSHAPPAPGDGGENKVGENSSGTGDGGKDEVGEIPSGAGVDDEDQAVSLDHRVESVDESP